MIQKTFHNTFERKVVVDRSLYRASEEAKICLNCTLSESLCKPQRCKRYRDEIQKLKSGGR